MLWRELIVLIRQNIQATLGAGFSVQLITSSLVSDKWISIDNLSFINSNLLLKYLLKLFTIIILILSSFWLTSSIESHVQEIFNSRLFYYRLFCVRLIKESIHSIDSFHLNCIPLQLLLVLLLLLLSSSSSSSSSSSNEFKCQLRKWNIVQHCISDRSTWFFLGRWLGCNFLYRHGCLVLRYASWCRTSSTGCLDPSPRRTCPRTPSSQPCKSQSKSLWRVGRIEWLAVQNINLSGLTFWTIAWVWKK